MVATSQWKNSHMALKQNYFNADTADPILKVLSPLQAICNSVGLAKGKAKAVTVEHQ
jgi:hypothetical protein